MLAVTLLSIVAGVAIIFLAPEANRDPAGKLQGDAADLSVAVAAV